jgi:hypothetical protein
MRACPERSTWAAVGTALAPSVGIVDTKRFTSPVRARYSPCCTSAAGVPIRSTANSPCSTSTLQSGKPPHVFAFHIVHGFQGSCAEETSSNCGDMPASNCTSQCFTVGVKMQAASCGTPGVGTAPMQGGLMRHQGARASTQGSDCVPWQFCRLRLPRTGRITQAPRPRLRVEQRQRLLMTCNRRDSSMLTGTHSWEDRVLHGDQKAEEVQHHCRLERFL